jgi:hypothetical protein
VVIFTDVMWNVCALGEISIIKALLEILYCQGQMNAHDYN